MQQTETPSTQRLVLAIDVGTSGTKVGLVNLQGQVVASTSGRYETHFLPDGCAEQLPADWWQVISNGVKQVVKQSGASAEDILAIAVTSQWSVTVAVDEQGQPLLNAISWMDTRGGKYNARLMKGFPSLEGYGLPRLLKWVNIVGMGPTMEGSDSLAHMQYIKYELPEIYRRTYKFLEPMDYINFCLTGKACATQNSNIATLIIDNRTAGRGDYDPWALRLSGLDRQKLPDLLPVEGIVGTLKEAIAAEWGLSPNAIVISSATDNSISPIGAGAIGDYEAVAVLGTSGMLVYHYPAKKTDLIHMLATVPSALKEKYLFSADTGNTGKVVDTFLNNLVYGQDHLSAEPPPQDIYLRLNQAAGQIPPGSEGVMFLPWFNGGALAPTVDPALRAGFINLSTRTSRDHLARAMLEGISYNWRWLKEAAEAFNGRKFPFWRITGGGANSPVWGQIMADVLGIPMHQQENPSHNSLLGIAFLAFHRLGLLSLQDIPSRVHYAHIYDPDPHNRELYDRLYAQFRLCHKQLKPVFHSLNAHG